MLEAGKPGDLLFVSGRMEVGELLEAGRLEHDWLLQANESNETYNKLIRVVSF